MVIDTFKYRAQINGTSLEHEIREVLKKHAVLTPEEKVAISREIRSRTKGIVPSLTLDEIREGLE